MRAPFRFPSHLWLAAGLGVLLIGLAGLQWRWIGRWSAAEEAQLERALRTGARDVDIELTRRLATIQDGFAETRSDDPRPAETLASHLRQWRTETDVPGLVEAVYWVTPGASPQLARLEGDTLVGLAWPERLTGWKEAFRPFPDTLRPDSRSSTIQLVLDAHAFPDLPPGVLVPALPRSNPRNRQLRFILVELSEDRLRNEILPTWVCTHIVGCDLYDIRIAGRTGVLYDSRPGLAADAFETPDLDVPLGLSEHIELTLSFDPTRGDAELDVAELQSETHTKADGLWQLQVRHRAGSIAAASRALRLRQLALAFGVLAVLGAATALLLLSVRRQRTLAQRQLAFVAGVTHELRTPLAVLHAAGENLSDGVVAEPEMTRRYGALVRDESRRLSDMVETVLSYAGADATTARRSRLSVRDWIEDASSQARPLLEEANTTLTLDLAPDLPDIHGDPLALATALRNLIANAARHGGSSVRITARATRLGTASAIALAVSDDGPGVSSSDQSAIFEAFVRGESAIVNQTPGSGLGLALVKRIVEAHAGTIELTTAPDTTFTITLPTSS